jgi:MFS family permease
VGIAIGGGTLADLWPVGKQRGAALLFFLLMSFLAPCVAPLAGSYTLAAHQGDWRWTQWLMVIVGLPIWLSTILMQETGVVSRRGLKERRRRTFLLRSISFPVRLLCSDMIVLLLTVHTAFAYGVIFSFFLSFKYVLVSEYQFTDQEASLSYISLVLGYVFAIILFILIERVSDGGECPEKQLHGSIAGGVLLLIGEIWSVKVSEAVVFCNQLTKVGTLLQRILVPNGLL